MNSSIKEFDESTSTFLPFEILNLLLKSDDLEVISEDQVLDSFILWYDVASQEKETHDTKLNDQIRKLTDSIRWNYININKLIKALSSRSQLCGNTEIRRIFREELNHRILNRNDINLNLFNHSKSLIKSIPPRKSYETFVREENAEFVLNRIADTLLDMCIIQQQPDNTKSSTIKPELKNCNILHQKYIQADNCSSTKSFNSKSIENDLSIIKSVNVESNYKEERENINLTNRSCVRKTSQPSLYATNKRSNKESSKIRNTKHKRNVVIEKSLHNSMLASTHRSRQSNNSSDIPANLKRTIDFLPANQNNLKFQVSCSEKKEELNDKLKADLSSTKQGPRIAMVGHQTRKFKKPSTYK